MRNNLRVLVVSVAAVMALVAVTGTYGACPGPAGTPCGNGDSNGDGRRDIADAIHLLTHLFAQGPEPVAITCGDASAAPIGRGYDIFGAYADRTEVKEPVLDAGALLQAGLIEEIALESSDYHGVGGTSIASYATALMQSCGVSGSYNGFSGAIKQAFSENRYTSTEYSFATVNINVHKKAHVVRDRNNIAGLKQYLSAAFAQRLNDPAHSPQELFATYGTHCMTGTIQGARLAYNVSASTSHISGDKSIAVYAEASYKSVLLEASVTSSGLTQEEYDTYKSSEEKRLQAYGGSSELAVNIATKGDYEAWINTISNNPVFCDYYPGSLMPIWELCDDDGRKAELTEAFAHWAIEREIILVTVPKKAIVRITVKNSYLGSYIDEEGLRHYAINQDLSEGAGGKTIIIYAAVGLDNDPLHPPITDLILWDAEDPKTPDLETAYQKVSGDLNEGAGGDLIYLYASTSPGKGDPIRAMCTNNVSDKDLQYSFGASSAQVYWPVLNTIGTWQDTSENAGGDWIGIMYSRDYID